MSISDTQLLLGVLKDERDLKARIADFEAELAEARQWKDKWETCEKWRKFYQEAKGKLYAMGGEVAEACWNHMPCNESQVDQWFRAEFVYKAAYDRVSAELAEARRIIEAERQGWKIALRTLINEPHHVAIIGNPASAARAEIDEIGAALVALAEARKDGERYRYIRTEAMIDYCTGSKRHNRISWPTIYAAAPVDGGSYRDRFDAAIDAARGAK